MKILRTDNGLEYHRKDFNSILNDQGIQRQYTTAHTPQQNGVAERANRTIFDMARCLLIQSGLPVSFRAEAVNTAVCIRNRFLTKSLTNLNPFEKWHGIKPSITHLRVFGCKAFALNKDPAKEKLHERSVECVLIGFKIKREALPTG